MQTLGQKINLLRKQKRISQEELADKLGVSRQTISKWESDIVRPNDVNIRSLCNEFNVNIDYFYESDIAQRCGFHNENGCSTRFLKSCFVILVVVFAILIMCTIIFGFVTLSPNKGDISESTSQVDVALFYVFLALTIIELMFCVFVFIKWMQIKCKQNRNAM